MHRRLGENLYNGREHYRQGEKVSAIPEFERSSASLRNRKKSQLFWNYYSLNISSSYNFVEFYSLYSLFRKHFLKLLY